MKRYLKIFIFAFRLWLRIYVFLYRWWELPICSWWLVSQIFLGAHVEIHGMRCEQAYIPHINLLGIKPQHQTFPQIFPILHPSHFSNEKIALLQEKHGGVKNLGGKVWFCGLIPSRLTCVPRICSFPGTQMLPKGSNFLFNGTRFNLTVPRTPHENGPTNWAPHIFPRHGCHGGGIRSFAAWRD